MRRQSAHLCLRNIKCSFEINAGKSFDYDQALGDPCRIFGEPERVNMGEWLR
jgi:hypothetical protein